MKTWKQQGYAAFPLEGNESVDEERGMSLRDYFAGQALAGMLANPKNTVSSPHVDSSYAYQYADAMLKEREK